MIKGVNTYSMVTVVNKILNLEKITCIKGLQYETRF